MEKDAMLYPESFELDGVRFIPGKMRGKSSNNEFLLVKKHAHLEVYRALCDKRLDNILEIGLFEGGSLVLFDKLYLPKKLVGVDIREHPISALEDYKQSRNYIITHYGVGQDDGKLVALLQKDLPEGIDLIVDDASHVYELSRATFQLCFPLLNPGGLYIIEDWSWSLMRAQQDPSHAQYGEKSLANLIFEIVLNVPGKQISKLAIYDQMVVIEKSKSATGQIDLSDVQKRLRGRSLPII